MIDPKKVTPLLTNMTVDQEIGGGPDGRVYLTTRKIDGRRMALKHIAIPSNAAQTKALIYAGVVKNEAEAQRYYASQVQSIKEELLMLNGIQNASNLLKFRGYQVDQKIVGVGFDVYLLADYCSSLPSFLASHQLTKLEAINLGIDLCSALEQLRAAGLLHKNVHPANVFVGESRRFMVGDLGLTKLEELDYASMPDHMITEYTAPEAAGEQAALSATMDVYSVGLILYEVYNGCVLPAGEDGRFVRAGAELEPPVYADMALSEIILKAISYRPEDRYQTPTEMKQALILYMQRGSISEEPLFPSQSDENEDAEVDVSAIAATVEAGQAAESAERSEDAPAEPGEAAGEDSEATQAETPVTEDTIVAPERAFDWDAPQPAPKVSLNDLGEDELIMPEDEEISVEDFLATLRQSSGLEVVSMDASGNTFAVPGYETEETLPEDTEFLDSADSREDPYTVEPPYDAGETIEPPANLDGFDFSVADQEPQRYDSEPEPYSEPERQEEPAAEYDDGYTDQAQYDNEPYEDDRRRGGWKAAVIAVIVLLVLAGGAFALYTFKTDTIRSMNSEVLSSSSVQIAADTKNSSAMEVVCSTATGEVGRVPLSAGTATFTDLNPNSTYTFTLASREGKLLLGSKTVEAKTAQMTNLTNFTVSSLAATSASFAVAGTGAQPDSWIITCTPDSGSPVSVEVTDVSRPVTVEGLTPAMPYTATIARGDGDQLSGTTACTFTTMDYTVLSSFAAAEVSSSSVTVAWDFSGTRPDAWSVTCAGTDGTSTTQEVSGTECTLDGLTAGVTYTITLDCPSLKETELGSISVGIPTVTVTSIVSYENDQGDIEVSWEFTGDAVPSQWSVSYVYDCVTAVTPTLAITGDSSVTLTNLLPDAGYTITVAGADDGLVGGNNVTYCVTSPAGRFDSYGVSDIGELNLYAMEDAQETPTTTFFPGEHIAFKVEASYEATDEDKHVKTLYVIRDESGTPVYVYRNDDPGRSWDGNWLTARHSGDGLDVPQEPGYYTLEVYFDGKLLASADFSVAS